MLGMTDEEALKVGAAALRREAASLSAQGFRPAARDHEDMALRLDSLLRKIMKLKER